MVNNMHCLDNIAIYIAAVNILHHYAEATLVEEIEVLS